MKKTLVIIISLLFRTLAVDTQNECLDRITVKQEFESLNKCNGGYPNLSKFIITNGNDKIDVPINDNNGYNKKVEAIFTTSEKVDKIKIDNTITGLGQENNTTYNPSYIFENLQNGINDKLHILSDAHHCNMIHRRV